MTYSRWIAALIVAAVVIAPGAALFAQREQGPGAPAPRAIAIADEPFPAHWIIGNVYYVGPRSNAVYLIATSAGHILVNTGNERSVPVIQESMKQLGFRLEDVKILLDSHGHSDHVGGHAIMKRLTGARVLVMEGDDDVMRRGGEGDFMFSAMDGFEPIPVDGVLKDGAEVRLGDTVLVAHKTPGHTKGTTTWTLRTMSAGKPYNVVIIGSTSINRGYKLVNNTAYPGIAEDYARTFQVLKGLPADVWLGAHGNYYGMEAKYARQHSRDVANPFIDPAGYQQYVSAQEKEYIAELARQKAAGN